MGLAFASRCCYRHRENGWGGVFLGAPSMVGAKFRIEAYNKNYFLPNPFRKIPTRFKSNSTNLKKNITLILNQYTKHFYTLNRNYANKFKINNNNKLNINRQNNQIIKTKKEVNLNKIHEYIKFLNLFKNHKTIHNSAYNNFLLNKKLYYNYKNNKENNSSNNYKNYNSIKHKLENNFYNLKKTHSIRSGKLDHNYNFYKNTSNNTPIHNFSFPIINNKHKILQNIINTRQSNETKSNLNHTKKINSAENIYQHTNNNDTNAKFNYKNNESNLHEIMNFVESELNQSLRSPPSGSLMSWVQSVPSYPGLHI